MLVIDPESAGAMRLHQAARLAFAARPDDDVGEYIDILSKGTLAAWDQFLASDRCATSLATLFKNRRCQSGLPSEVRQLLSQHTKQEVMASLMTRNQVRGLAAHGFAGGWPTVVLKGGLSAALGAALFHLTDIDILVPADRARRLAACLDQSGHRALGASSARHLRIRVPQHGLPVEIHTTLELWGSEVPAEVWDRIQPIPGIPGAFRLTPIDHVWHMLVHVVSDHPGRCVRLRDLLLIGDALRDCDPTEVAEMNRRISAHQDQDVYRATLQYALHLGSGFHEPDPYPAVTLANCHFHHQAPRRWVPLTIHRQTQRWVVAVLVSRDARRSIWREVCQDSLDRSPVPWIARAEGLSPILGRAVRLAVRFVVRVISRIIASPVASQVRRTAARISQHPRVSHPISQPDPAQKPGATPFR